MLRKVREDREEFFLLFSKHRDVDFLSFVFLPSTAVRNHETIKR